MSPPPIVQLFYNVKAGHYSPGRIDALVQALRAAGAKVRLTPSADGLPQLAPDTTHVCVAGGDGTVRHVGAAVVNTNPALPLAIYPMGTVNLLAREAQVPRNPGKLAQLLVHGGADRPHHPVRVGNDMFFACASAGPDSYAVASVSLRLKRWIGRLAYAVSFLHLLANWPRFNLRLSANGQSWPCEAVFIAKGRYYAGPWSFAPQAQVGDGLLHVVALKTARRRDFLGFCWSLLRGMDPGSGGNTIAFTCTALRLDADELVPLQGDGDILGCCPLDMAVDARAVQVR